MTLLKVDSLHSGYGRIPILTGITFDMGEGEFIGILGHNGMGKTTLLKTLVGALPLDKGSIQFDGAELSALPTHLRIRKGISYVPQGRAIFPALSVQENLEFAGVALPGGRGGQIDQVLELIPRLKRLLDRPGGGLSGGEQQLLALGRALVQKPRLILLDEPTEGIQPSIIEEIVALLLHLKADSGISLLLVEQNIDFIRALSTRVLLIQKGAIAHEFQIAELSEAMVMGDFGGELSDT